MNSWVNFHALWQIVVLGLICGAGLPALFAVGLRALNLSAQPCTAETDHIVGGSAIGIALASACFAVVLAALGWGIYFIVAGS